METQNLLIFIAIVANIIITIYTAIATEVNTREIKKRNSRSVQFKVFSNAQRLIQNAAMPVEENSLSKETVLVSARDFENLTKAIEQNKHLFREKG